IDVSWRYVEQAGSDPCGVRPRALFPGIDRSLELLLGHLRTACDVATLRFVVELLLRAALRAARPRAQAAPAVGRHVVRRGTGRSTLRLAGPRSLLVDRARRDLLGALRRAALFLLRLLDVLVLTFALRAPS